MTCRSAYVIALLVAIVCPERATHAQSPDCTYDRCALRLQLRFFSERVVQGAAAAPVGRLGLFAPRVEPLATAGDSARTHYEAFRTYQNRGGALTLVGAIAGVAATIILVSHTDFPSGDPPAGVWALAGVGITFGIAGGINIRKGRDHLLQAVWFYNGSLVAAP